MQTHSISTKFGWLSTALVLFIAAMTTVQAAPGDLDTTFGRMGKMRVAVGGNNDNGNALARQADGKLIVTGQSRDVSGIGFSLVRYYANGTLDLS